MERRDWHGLSFADIDPRLCTLCGTCISACPVGALAWRDDETITFDRAKCVDCGLCYAVCPPENPQGAALPAGADPLLGPYRSLGRVHAADPAVRKAGSAGGAVTALLLSALEQGEIDGALVVATGPQDPTRPRVSVARTPAEIRAAAQSKYCLAPVNAALAQVGREERLAAVVLPCQAHGLRLAQALDLSLGRNVVLTVGLFCGFQVRYQGTRHLLGKLGMRPEDVRRLEYRSGTWPGGLRAVARDGREGFIPKHQYAYVHLCYTPEGCWYCPDLTAEHADLSVGDYWSGRGNEGAGVDYAAEPAAGYSMVIARTERGQSVLAHAAQRQAVVAEPISYERVLASHHHLLAYKKKGVQVRRRLARRKPVAGYPLPALAARDALGSTFFFGLMRLGSGRLGRWLVDRLPLAVTGRLSAQGRSLFRK